MPEVVRSVRRKGKIDVAQAIKDKFVRGLDYSEIASKNNCSYQAVRQRLQPIEEIILSKQEVKDFRENEVSLLDSAKMALLVAALHPDRIKKATTQQCIWGYGVLTDKSLLLQGKATQIIESKSMVLQAHKTLEEIQDRLKSAQIIDNEDTATPDSR